MIQDQIVVADVEPLSQIERVFDVFIAPTKTFMDIRRSTSWWVPFVIGTIFAYALAAGIQERIGWSQLADNQIHANPRAEERLAASSPEQSAMQHKAMTYSFKASFYATPVVNLVSWLLYAVVLWSTINYVFGGKAAFGQVFTVINYAFLPMALKPLIAAIMLFLNIGSENFTLENMLNSSPGSYISSPGVIKTFLTCFDIFTLWTLLILSIGLAIVAKKNCGSGFYTVFGWWLLVVLVKTGFAAITS